MIRPVSIFSTLLAIVLAAAPGALPAQSHPAKPADSNGPGAFATNVYSNLFAKAGHSQQEIDAKIQAAYRQLFHGDPKTQRLYFDAGKNKQGRLAFVTDWANHDVRTEGMSYAMMISVEMNHKAEFDALWNWVMTYMYISDPKRPAHGYFAWSCKTDGTRNSEGPAPDGEEYFAMALLFAGNRWPGGHGMYDYHARAEGLLHTMLHHPVVSVQTPHGPRGIGPELNREHAMILFVPGIMPQPFTDPSYQLPAFYELFARWGPTEDRALWERAAAASRAFFVKTANPKTGLAPDYANFDGSPHTSRFPQSGEFGYDAWRVARNWSVDWSWWRKASAEQTLSNRIQAFFASQGIDSYGPVYTLAGKPLGATPGLTVENHPAGLVGTNAVASLAATDRRQAMQFVNALWKSPIPSGENRYYDGMLYLMSMLHVSGEFHILRPQS